MAWCDKHGTEFPIRSGCPYCEGASDDGMLAKINSDSNAFFRKEALVRSFITGTIALTSAVGLSACSGEPTKSDSVSGNEPPTVEVAPGLSDSHRYTDELEELDELGRIDFSLDDTEADGQI